MPACTKCGHEVRERDPNVVHKHRICPKRRGVKKRVRVQRKGTDALTTMARLFKHPKSRVMLDGREILYGLDYKARVREVLERDGYKCQWPTGPACNLLRPWEVPLSEHAPKCGGSANNHPHHIVKRSKLRDDRAENLMAICDAHHKIAHPEFRPRWTRKPAAEKEMHR